MEGRRSRSAPTARPCSAPSSPPAWTRIIAASTSRPRARTARPSSTSRACSSATCPTCRSTGAAGGGGSIDDVAVVPRRRQGVPDQHRGPVAADVPRRRRRRPRCQAGRAGRRRRRARATRRSSTTAWSCCPKRPMMGRFFDPRVGYFTDAFEDYAAPQAAGWRSAVHRPLPPGEEGPRPRSSASRSSRSSSTCQPRGAGEVAAVPEEGRRGLEAGVREGRVQERDHLQGRPEPRARTRTGTRRTPATRVIRWVAEPIAERDGAARPRPALRRDHLGPHHLLARHRQARADVVLRAVLGAATRAPQAAAARRADRRAAALRLLPRSRPHARPAAQPPRQPGVHRSASSATRSSPSKNGSVGSIMSYGRFNYVAQPEDKVEAPDPDAGPVRLLRHRVGLQADPGREDRRGREDDARRVGGRADRRTRSCASAARTARPRSTRPC